MCRCQTAENKFNSLVCLAAGRINDAISNALWESCAPSVAQLQPLTLFASSASPVQNCKTMIKFKKYKSHRPASNRWRTNGKQIVNWQIQWLRIAIVCLEHCQWLCAGHWGLQHLSGRTLFTFQLHTFGAAKSYHNVVVIADGIVVVVVVGCDVVESICVITACDKNCDERGPCTNLIWNVCYSALLFIWLHKRRRRGRRRTANGSGKKESLINFSAI